MTATPVAAAAVAGPAGRWTRWSDRLNPILVREVQQAVKGRVFALTVIAALLVTVAIAASVANRYESGGSSGRGAFAAGLATLMPLILFIVPMQAYQSMRLEMRSGIVEQLLLSRLRPLRILTGKLQAALVQFVIYVSVMSPLLATSYLLRGVDVPTIVISLVLAALACVLATMFAISSAAQGALPGLQAIANLATAFGLGMAAFGAVGFVGSGAYAEAIGWLLRSGDFWTVMSAIVLVTLLGCVLSMLAAQSFLLHAFENKATGFRIYLFVVPLVACTWFYACIDPAYRDEAFAVLLFGLLLLGVLFGVFFVTEQGRLSPRLQAHAPRRPLAGLLAAPFLPGRDRGTACFLLYLLLLGALALLAPRASATPRDVEVITRMGAMTAVYALVYFGIGRWLRSRLPASVTGNHVARFLLPLTLFLGIIAPLLIDAFVRREVGEWHPGHLLNPFLTIAEFAFRSERWEAVQSSFLVALVVVVVLQLPACLRGVREVLAAGAAARARERGDG